MLNSWREWLLRRNNIRPTEFGKVEEEQRSVVESIKEKRIELEAAIEQLKKARTKGETQW